MPGCACTVGGTMMRMLDGIDWRSLRHAYGRAGDTPRHLAALTSGDAAAASAALEHLDIAIVHQGAPYSATAPAARYVARLLAANMVPGNLRAAIVEFLSEVAQATALAETWTNDYAEKLIPELYDALLTSYPVVAFLIDDLEGPVRRLAAEAACWHVRTRVLADQRPVLAARLRALAKAVPVDRTWYVRLLGEIGDDTRSFMDDSDGRVRVVAALAPGLAADPAATDIIVSALAHAGEHGIRDPSVFTLGELVEAAITRAGFDRIAAVAPTITRNAESVGFHNTWGPLIRAAFPRPYHNGTPLTGDQAALLAALVANPSVWDYRIGNSLLILRECGLPFDREKCAAIARQS